jgi:hypothetical protein
MTAALISGTKKQQLEKALEKKHALNKLHSTTIV